jgi:hypothetical protein
MKTLLLKGNFLLFNKGGTAKHTGEGSVDSTGPSGSGATFEE